MNDSPMFRERQVHDMAEKVRDSNGLIARSCGKYALKSDFSPLYRSANFQSATEAE
jgi:hypothetical protein